MTSIKFRALDHNDHKLFFEALGEYGKDFQNIQQYMSQKCGKNSTKPNEQSRSIDPQEKKDQEKKEDDKKREQIRNFYNKLYTKLSQLIGKTDERVERVNQELYLLINYGEIWKKHGFKFNNKTKKLLEELVYQGYTTLRFKNKNVRLRTPPCKALKKINEIGIDEKVKVVTTRELPKDVIVEFNPANHKDWLRVQSLSQNPRVRGRLSIQKRISHILSVLESKWNISQEKLNHTVDVWLKVPPNNNQAADQMHPQSYCTANNSNDNGNSFHGTNRAAVEANNNSTTSMFSGDQLQLTSPNLDIHQRIRLKPSAKHELNEVNITRVIPDNHLDLSLNAYIKRLSESKSNLKTSETQNAKNSSKDSSLNLISANATNEKIGFSENIEFSQGAASSNSRLPISLTTPDSSILLERSYTSDQPSIAQARKHLNILQSLAGSYGGCENSRTACEDTQDRTLLPPIETGTDNLRPVGFSSQVNHQVRQSTPDPTNSSVLINNDIPALFDENAAIDTNIAISAANIQVEPEHHTKSNHASANCDSQNSKSVDFNIPKNVTLGDWFKMSERDGDDANDAFPSHTSGSDDDRGDIPMDTSHNEIEESPDIKPEDNNITNGVQTKMQNHMIEIQKIAEGWTRNDEPSMTIGQLYLAFKCPEIINLEYEFQQFTYDVDHTHMQQYSNDNLAKAPSTPSTTTVIHKSPNNNSLMFKLLKKVGSLHLAKQELERQKQEQQLKLQDQPCSKFKRRKGFGQSQSMTPHDIETRNQRVDEVLKKLQPTRLSVYRRAR